MTSTFEKLFPQDVLTKRERVEATLALQPVDRAAILEQLSYNGQVIALYTGRPAQGFDYTVADICEVIRKTTDLIMPPLNPVGTARVTDEDGFVLQHDNWTTWHVSRPFADEKGARDWLLRKTARLQTTPFDPRLARRQHHAYLADIQRQIGDTVILHYAGTGMCDAFDKMGLQLFTYFYADYPEVFAAYMQASMAHQLAWVHAVADPALSPVVLIAEDFATKHGPIFPPAFLYQFHYPNLQALTEAWHAYGIKVLYHSDGNWKKVIPDLVATGVDGFYCLEPNNGMDIVALKNAWPRLVWSGGVDGVDLMERGAPEQVRAEVQRQITATDALETGGMFVATSSEINPPIPAANYRAMVEAVGALPNPRFHR